MSRVRTRRRDLARTYRTHRERILVGKASATHRRERLPEIEVGLGRLGDPGSPGREHDGGAGGEGERRREPRVGERVEHLLVVDVEDHVQRPPRGEVDPDLGAPRGLRGRGDLDHRPGAVRSGGRRRRGRGAVAAARRRRYGREDMLLAVQRPRGDGEGEGPEEGTGGGEGREVEGLECRFRSGSHGRGRLDGGGGGGQHCGGRGKDGLGLGCGEFSGSCRRGGLRLLRRRLCVCGV